MVKRHLKRISMPKSWPVCRKTTKFVIRPFCGAHSMEYGMPLGLVLSSMIGVGKTAREVRYVLNSGDVLVDGVVRKEPHFIVGFMDVISLPKLNLNYRIVINKKGVLSLSKVSEKEKNLKICRIIGKVCKNKKIQLNLSSGRNILIDKNGYKVGDSLLISVPNQEIKEHFAFEKGAIAFMIGGKHIGELATIENINENTVGLRTESGVIFENLKKYVFVVGKKTPSISLSEAKE